MHGLVGMSWWRLVCRDAPAWSGWRDCCVWVWLGGMMNRELACSTDDQSRATKQEQANLCAVTVLCAST